MCEALRPRPAWPTGQRVWGFSSSPAPATPRPQPNTQGEESTGTCLPGLSLPHSGDPEAWDSLLPRPSGHLPISPAGDTASLCRLTWGRGKDREGMDRAWTSGESPPPCTGCTKPGKGRERVGAKGWGGFCCHSHVQQRLRILIQTCISRS